MTLKGHDLIQVAPFSSLGGTDIAWLSAQHHFSFGHYYDPERMGHGVQHLWNDDTIQPASGFDPHPHRDMEIITYVREGAITHIDKLGNRGRTEAGDVQVMHAGTGIVHAEYNHEPDVTRIVQIWIAPDTNRVGRPRLFPARLLANSRSWRPGVPRMRWPECCRSIRMRPFWGANLRRGSG